MRSANAGAPLRAIGALATFWILMRIVVWNVSDNQNFGPMKPLQARDAFLDSTLEEKPRMPCVTGCDYGQAFRVPSNVKQVQDAMILIDRSGRDDDSKVTDWALKTSHPRQQLIQSRINPITQIRDGFSEQIQIPSLEIAIVPPPIQNLVQRRRRKEFESYFWTFVRQDTRDRNPSEGTEGLSVSNGRYGGSQIGAILSYPISSQPSPDLLVYARATAALAPLRQEEVAFGMRVRPINSIPISFYAEQRIDLYPGGNQGMAFFAAGGTNPKRIIEKLTLEAYGQAGYVRGKNETYFFDGSAILQRPIAEHDRKTLTIGAGVWSGGQREIARLDIGPRAGFQVPLGTASARVAVDWRFRIAGNAQPESGMAITVSTGF